MYKVKILLFLWGMEELTAGLNALRQWQLHKGGGNEWKRQRECVERSERVFCAQLFGAFSLVVGFVLGKVALYLS